MYFIKCSYLKKRFFFNRLLKQLSFCGFFQINLGLPDAISIFKEFKKILFDTRLKFMFCSKKNDFKFLGLNKLMKGPILVIFCNRGFNLICLFNEFFSFLSNKLTIVSLCFFLYKRFMFLNHLQNLRPLAVFYNIHSQFIYLLKFYFFRMVKIFHYGK